MTNSRAGKTKLATGVPFAHTIASGAITLTGLNSYISVDTEASASTDDLDTINGGSEGDILIIKSVVSARDPTLKHESGNISLKGSVDYVIAFPVDKITLIKVAGGGWTEISRSNN